MIKVMTKYNQLILVDWGGTFLPWYKTNREEVLFLEIK